MPSSEEAASVPGTERRYEDEPDPRWEVEPEPPDDDPDSGRGLRVVVGGLLLATAALLLLAVGARSVGPVGPMLKEGVPTACETREIGPGVLRSGNDGHRDVTMARRGNVASTRSRALEGWGVRSASASSCLRHPRMTKTISFVRQSFVIVGGTGDYTRN
jgi:hypothetical protein